MKITQCFENSAVRETTTQRLISEDKFSLFCTIKFGDLRTRGTLAAVRLSKKLHPHEHCHGWGWLSLACRPIPRQLALDIRWTKWHWLKLLPVQLPIIIPPAIYVYLSSKRETVSLLEDAAVPTENISPHYRKKNIRIYRFVDEMEPKLVGVSVVNLLANVGILQQLAYDFGFCD